MNRDHAIRLVGLVSAAWDWDLEDSTRDIWETGFANFTDPELLEITIYSLHAHLLRRPRMGDFTAAYQQARADQQREAAFNALPESAPTTANMQRVRALLAPLKAKLKDPYVPTPRPFRPGDIARVCATHRRIVHFWQTGDRCYPCVFTEIDAKASAHRDREPGERVT